MKIAMRKLCLISTILLLPFLTSAQFIGDTLVVYVDNRAEVKVAIPDYADAKMLDDVSSGLQGFISILPEIASNLDPQESEQVHYVPGGALTISPGDSKLVYLTKEGSLANTGFRDRAIIKGEKYTLFITTTDLASITDLSLEECMTKLRASLPEKTHWPRSIYYECTSESIKELENRNNALDYLALQFGAGAGLVKGVWVADVAFGVSLGLNHKGLTRSPYINANMVFDFGPENTMNLNTFVNVGYAWSTSRTSPDPDVLGFEVGYLVSRQGELFGENTIKLGVTWSPAKHINVTPQLYISDNFNQVFPGIRVGFGL